MGLGAVLCDCRQKSGDKIAGVPVSFTALATGQPGTGEELPNEWTLPAALISTWD